MHFRLLAGPGAGPAGGPGDRGGEIELAGGEGQVELAGGALVVTPAAGQALRVAPADVLEITEPQPYVVRLSLSDGAALELSRLGAMRTRLLAELAEARIHDTGRTLLLDGIGRPEAFPCVFDGMQTEALLYDDALVAGTEKVPYPFIRDISTDPSGYRISVAVVGRPPYRVERLARRTGEFLELLRARVSATSGRTAHFLAALLPGLGPAALYAVAGHLRDGLAGARADLDAVDPTVWPALVEAATLPERSGAAGRIAGLGYAWIGFKQTVSVERAGSGGPAWRDSSVGPRLDHGGYDGSFGTGLSGVMAASMLGFDGPFDAFGPPLAMAMLGTGFGSGYGGGYGGGYGPFGGGPFGGGPHLPRADVSRPDITPAHTDYGALDVTAVLAFMLSLTESGHLLYEVLNQPDHATYVFRAGGTDEVQQLNRALDLLGFRVEGVYQDVEGGRAAGSPYRKAAERLPALRILRERFTGRVVHTEGWDDRLGRLLAS